MWPSTMWSLSSFTRNIVLGSASTISPSISIFSSFDIRETLAAKVAGNGCELRRVGGLGCPGQLQRIVGVAGNHVYVEVEDRLPRGPPHVVEDVESGRLQRLLHALDDAPHRRDGGDQVVLRHRQQVLAVVPRDHHHVPARGGVDVHHRDRALVGIDDLAGDLSGDDLAEDAVRVAHRENCKAWSSIVPPPMTLLASEAIDRQALRRLIDELCLVERPSASEGEREAAEWIAAQFRDAGLDTRVEAERAHGGFWWPIGLLNAIAAVAAAIGSRLVAAGALALLADDIDHRKRVFRRMLLPRRTTWNVTAVAGDPQAEQTIVLVAHHDAAHGGAIYDTTVAY